MQYLRNVDITKQYPISEATVRKWIKASKDGRSKLTLIRVGEREYIANTASNIVIMKQLAEERRKYRNAIAAKIVQPQPRFYKLFTQAQIYDIVTDLELHHEISRQYNYIDGGAANWDEYAQRLATEESPNTLTSTLKLIEENQQYIDFLLRDYSRINIVDIGVGNAVPVKGLIQHLLDHNKLGRYIALDISNEMLDIAKHNIQKWFGNKVPFEGYENDINYDRFANLLAEEYLNENAEKTANLVLLLGGTLSNFREPEGAFRVIRGSMGSHDFLIHSQKLDSIASRKYFDFNAEPSSSSLSPNHRFIFDLLNIDESFYDVEMGYNSDLGQRYIQVRLKVALTIEFDFEVGKRKLEFNKGDSILLWRVWQRSALEVANQFSDNGFLMLHSSQTPDGEYILTTSKVQYGQ
jgi:uncharacterized SAM-dependent methyltransferase